MSEYEENKALNKAVDVARYYYSEAVDILDPHEGGASVSDCVELAKVMSQDFHSSMMFLMIKDLNTELSNIGFKLRCINDSIEEKK